MDLSAQLAGASRAGMLDAEMQEAFEVINLGDTLQDNIGCAPSDIDSTEVFGFFGIVDDSTSIRISGNTQAVQDGYNAILQSLAESNMRDDIIVATTLLNKGMVHQPTPLVNGVTLSGLVCQGKTKLYDRVIETCGLALKKWNDFTSQGSDFRGVIFLLSDGQDEGSRASLKKARKTVETLISNEVISFIAMGVKNKANTDFRKVFGDMGIPAEWILEIGSDPHSIRDACGVVSRAAVRASQAGGLSQVSGINAFIS